MNFTTTTLLASRKTVALCVLTAMMALGTSNIAHAGGVALGSTRLIYPQGTKQVNMTVTNSDEQQSFLVQSWVSTADGKKSADFVITPPLFVLKPAKDNILRVMYTGPELPKDKESLFYLNSKAIPAMDKSKIQGNALQIATQSVIKLFVRPANLAVKSADAPAMLTCKLNGSTLNITNPSPYYVTLVSLNVGGEKLANTMVPPQGNKEVKVSASGSVSYQTMNDFGAITQKQSCK